MTRQATRTSPPQPTLLGVPYDGGSSFLRGSAEAPGRIREALHSPATNGWSESLVEVVPRIGDAGDVHIAEEGEARGAIEAAVRGVLTGGGAPLVLGGDHSITYPVLRALRGHHPRLTIVHFDAHPDLYEDYEGDPFSHASPFARILEEGLADRLVSVGIRTMNAAQQRQADRFGVEVVPMARWAAGDRFEVEGPTYLSIDVDAFDPAFAPGVSHREPGGFTPREVLTAIQGIRARVVGADIVELNPRQDPLGITAPLCAKLVKEVAARMLDPETAKR